MSARTSLFAVVFVLIVPQLVACSPKRDTAATTSDTGATATAGGGVATDVGTVRRAIEENYTRFNDAFKRGDTATVASFYTDDAILMMPNAERSRGREGVRKAFAGFFSAMTVKDFKASTDDVIVGGDLAVESGTYEWTVQPKGAANAKEMKDKGKYITVWRRQSDGSWKIVRDIINSDLPPAKT